MYGNTTPTVIGAISTYTKILGTTTASPVMNGFTMPINNRLVYGATVTKPFTYAGNISVFHTQSSAQTIAVAAYINGTYQVGSVSSVSVPVGTVPITISFTSNFAFPGSNYIELWVANFTSGSNVTVSSISLNIF